MYTTIFSPSPATDSSRTFHRTSCSSWRCGLVEVGPLADQRALEIIYSTFTGYRSANMCSAEPPLYTRGGKFNVADKMYTHLLQISNIQKLSLLPPSHARSVFPPPPPRCGISHSSVPTTKLPSQRPKEKPEFSPLSGRV